MREIKFRAWNKTENKMINDFWSWNPESIECKWMVGHVKQKGHEYRKLGEEFELMQFTGLKDKQGKEIYEDDVIAPKSDSSGNGHVYWDIRLGGFRVSWDDGSLDAYHDWGKLGVIGNIYEHSALLK